MSGQLEVELMPIGSDHGESSEYYLNLRCEATYMRDAVDWQKSALEIKWSATEKVFFVQFNGKRPHIDYSTSELLSKRIPLQIAHSSRCECGTTLKLGDYPVSVKNSDFSFHGEYFCPNCKSQLIAEGSGFKKMLERWFSSLKRIEVRATGFRIERVVGGASVQKS